jgi:hypothetical protein
LKGFMKIIIENIEVKEDEIRAVFSMKGTLDRAAHVNDYEIVREVTSRVAKELSRQILMERGPKILEDITNNQIINAVIMRVAGSLTNKD